MKTPLIFTALFCLCAFVSGFAQVDCDQMIADADRSKNYKEAISKYNAALVCNPAKKQLIDRKLLALFNKIEAQKNQAVRAKNKLQKANKQILNERDKAQKAEKEATKQAQIADRASMANYNAALALQTLRHDPTRALRIAELNKNLFPDAVVSEANYYQLLGDTSLNFYMRRQQMGEEVKSIATSPDGKWLATGLSDGTIVLSSADGDKEAASTSWSASEREIRALAFSPDSRYLLSAGQDRITRLWDTQKPREAYKTFAKQKQAINSVAFHPEGQFFATCTEEEDGSDELLRIWSIADTTAPAKAYKGYTSTIRTVAYAPDGKTLAVGGDDNAVAVWDTDKTDAPRAVLTAHNGDVLSIVFSTDSRHLFSGDSKGMIHAWDLQSPEKPIQNLDAHANAVMSMCLSANGAFLISGSADRTINLWTPLERTAPIRTYNGHEDHVTALGFIQGTTSFWSGSEDQTLRKWSIRARPIPVRGMEAAPGAITGLLRAADNQSILYSSTDGYIRRLETSSGKDTVVQAIKAHQYAISALAASADRKTLASVDFSGEIKLWAAAPKLSSFLTIPASNSRPNCLALAPNQPFLAAGGSDSLVYIWNFKQPKAAPIILKGHIGRISALSFSGSGALLASGSEDNTIKVWSVDKGKAVLQQTLSGHASNITSLTFGAGDSTLYSGALDKTIRIWNLADANQAPKVLTSGTSGTAQIAAITAFETEPIIAAGTSDGQLRIWQLNTEAVPYWTYFRTSADDGRISSLTTDKDENRIIAGYTSGQIKWLNTPGWFVKEQLASITETELLQAGFNMHADSLLQIADSPENKAVVAEVLFSKGEYQQARQLWKELIDEQAEASYYLGWYEAAKMQQQDVSDQLLAMDSIAYLEQFAEYFLEKGKWDLSRQFYLKLRTLKPDALNLTGLYEASFKGNQLPDTLFNSVQNPKTLSWLMYYLSRRVNKRWAGDDEIIQVKGDLVRLVNLKAKLDTTKKTDPWYPAIDCWNIANAHMRRGEYVKAYDRMQEGLRFYPGHPHLYTTLPGSLIYIERYDEALEIINKLKDKKYDPRRGIPTYKEAFIMNLESLEKSGRLNETQRQKVQEFFGILRGKP